MRKILSKIAGLALGLSLAAGVGVSLASHKAGEVRADSISSNFTDKNLSVGTGELTWTASIAANSFESASPSRGVQFGAAKGEFTLTATLDGSPTITAVGMTVSTNGTAALNTIKVKVGSTYFTCNSAETYEMPKENGLTPSFIGSSTGTITIEVNNAHKSVYFKNISVTYGSGGGTTTYYTVTFNMHGHGSQISSQSVAEGDPVSKPSDPTEDGYTFDGWYLEDSYDTEWDFENNTVSDTTELHAKWTALPSEGEWVATDITDLSSTDVFVIANSTGSSHYALPSASATSSPSAVSVTISDGKITSAVGSNLKWNISGNGTDGYVFAPDGSSSSYLYLLADSNTGVRVGSTSNAANHFTINQNLLYTTETKYARHVGVYTTTPDWRCYKLQSSGAPATNFSGQSVGFYKYVEEGGDVGTQIKLSAENIEMDYGQAAVSIVVKNADDLSQVITGCEFSSSNTAVASISEGKVVAQGGGTATITVTHAADTSDPTNPISYKSTTFTVTVIEVETIESIVKALKDVGSGDTLAGTHTIKGTVTGNYVGTKKNYMIQQGDYGMYLFDTKTDLNVGDVVRVTGTFGRYNNWMETKSISSIVKLSETAESISAPVISDLSTLTDEYQNRVVTFTGLEYVSGTPGSSDTSINFKLGTAELVLRTTAGISDETNINAKLAEVAEKKDTATFNLVGVHYTVFNSAKQFKVDNATKIQIIPTSATVTQLVEDFVDTCMHMSDIPVSEESRQSDTNACSVTGGYYEVAKSALTALGAEAIAEFQDNDEFNDAQERYESWAQIYGDATPYEVDVTPIAGSSHYMSAVDNKSSTIIIVVVALTSITSIGVLLVIKRRRSLVK